MQDHTQISTNNPHSLLVPVKPPATADIIADKNAKKGHCVQGTIEAGCRPMTASYNVIKLPPLFQPSSMLNDDISIIHSPSPRSLCDFVATLSASSSRLMSPRTTVNVRELIRQDASGRGDDSSIQGIGGTSSTSSICTSTSLLQQLRQQQQLQQQQLVSGTSSWRNGKVADLSSSPTASSHSSSCDLLYSRSAMEGQATTATAGGHVHSCNDDVDVDLAVVDDEQGDGDHETELFFSDRKDDSSSPSIQIDTARPTGRSWGRGGSVTPGRGRDMIISCNLFMSNTELPSQERPFLPIVVHQNTIQHQDDEDEDNYDDEEYYEAAQYAYQQVKEVGASVAAAATSASSSASSFSSSSSAVGVPAGSLFVVEAKQDETSNDTSENSTTIPPTIKRSEITETDAVHVHDHANEVNEEAGKAKEEKECSPIHKEHEEAAGGGNGCDDDDDDDRQGPPPAPRIHYVKPLRPTPSTTTNHYFNFNLNALDSSSNKERIVSSLSSTSPSLRSSISTCINDLQLKEVAAAAQIHQLSSSSSPPQSSALSSSSSVSTQQSPRHLPHLPLHLPLHLPHLPSLLLPHTDCSSSSDGNTDSSIAANCCSQHHQCQPIFSSSQGKELELELQIFGSTVAASSALLANDVDNNLLDSDHRPLSTTASSSLLCRRKRPPSTTDDPDCCTEDPDNLTGTYSDDPDNRADTSNGRHLGFLSADSAFVDWASSSVFARRKRQRGNHRAMTLLPSYNPAYTPTAVAAPVSVTATVTVPDTINHCDSAVATGMKEQIIPAVHFTH